MDHQHDPISASLRGPTLDHPSNTQSIRPRSVPTQQCGPAAEVSETAESFDNINGKDEQIDGFGEEIDEKHAGSESGEEWEAEVPEHEGEGKVPTADDDRKLAESRDGQPGEDPTLGE